MIGALAAGLQNLGEALSGVAFVGFFWLDFLLALRISIQVRDADVVITTKYRRYVINTADVEKIHVVGFVGGFSFDFFSSSSLHMFALAGQEGESTDFPSLIGTPRSLRRQYLELRRLSGCPVSEGDLPARHRRS